METARIDIDKILDELYGYSMFGIKLGLENIKRLCKALGNPQDSYKVIHLAGTNGKGSTATTIEKCLIEAGFNVGKFTSPHILKFNERIQLNGIEISDEKISEYFLRIKKVLEQEEIKGTFFEVTTAMMFLYFSDMNIDYLVLETGLGGRYDATNVVESEIAIVTNISLDHVSFLGDDIYSIAKEKAGIIKENSKVIVGDSQKDVAKAILDEKSDYIDVVEKYKNVKYTLDVEKYTTKIELDGEIYEYSLFGDYQVNNFLCAYEALISLGISKEIIRTGASKVKWPGRFEVVKRDPLLILDGAHNVDAAIKLKENLALAHKKDEVVAIVSVLGDKDVEGVLNEIRGFTDTVILTSLKHFKRGLNSEELKIYATGFKNVILEDDINKAYEKALEFGKTTVVCGSFYLLGEFLGGLDEELKK